MLTENKPFFAPLLGSKRLLNKQTSVCVRVGGGGGTNTGIQIETGLSGWMG